MSTHTTSGPTVPRQQRNPWAVALTTFGGDLMIISGIWGVLLGVSAVRHDEVYTNGPRYLYHFDITAWGWVHLIIGLLVAAAGVGILRGATWGRLVGVTVAGMSLMANFAFIPYYPIWSILVIVLDVIVIWALANYRREA